MNPRSPLLVGHDGSAEAAVALQWAASMAAALDGCLVVATAYAVGTSVGGPDHAAIEAGARLDGWLEGADLGGLNPDRIRTATLARSPGPALVELAGINDAGLLVIGAHGPVARWALGRVAHHVTFRSPCPVAVVRGQGGPVSSAPLMVGFDAADRNDQVIRWASNLAVGLGVPLEAVTVTADAPADDGRALDGRALDGSALDDMAVDDSEVFHLAEPGDHPLTRLCTLDGEPGPQLEARAAEISASAVVIGQRRRRNMGGRLLGGTAAWLLHNADRPVIVLHHD